MDLSSLTKKDLSRLPKNLLSVLQDKELSMPQKMMAFNMLIPNLPADPKHENMYNQNIDKIGYPIKRLVDEGKISINGLDKDFKLNIITNSQ
jgi:hypothetical protein